MRTNLFKYAIAVFWLITYINRGLFVAAPGVELSNVNGHEHPHCVYSHEVNTMLELILNWAGMENCIDEDGDCPEPYDAAKILQPLIPPNQADKIFRTQAYNAKNKRFHQFDENIHASDYQKVIDHPPELFGNV